MAKYRVFRSDGKCAVIEAENHRDACLKSVPKDKEIEELGSIETAKAERIQQAHEYPKGTNVIVKGERITKYYGVVAKKEPKVTQTKSKHQVFKKGQVVVAKDEWIAAHEKPEDTVGIVVDHNPDNDYLVIGSTHPWDYGIAPTFSMRGEYYRLATRDEVEKWGLLENVKRIPGAVVPKGKVTTGEKG